MPVKTFNVPTGAPGSPWAQRFGHLEERHQYSLVKKDDLVHSHLAPLNPNLDPRYYDVVPDSNDFEPPRSLAELDETLITEESQRIRHLGLPTWKAIALGSAVTWDGGPALLSGNRPGDDELYDECIKKYLSERIEVDESTWFPFFRKDRWVNTNLMNDRDFIVDRDGTRREVKTWSVDDERVWSIVRFSLEIANRILKAMIRDSNEWLGTLLYGRIQLWRELNEASPYFPKGQIDPTRDNRILLPPAVEKQECENLDVPFSGRDIEPDTANWSKLIEKLMESLFWSFSTANESHRGDTLRMYQEKPPRIVCRITASVTAVLCGEAISVAERCLMQFSHAQAMLHELMHAIYYSRLLAGENLSPEVKKQVETESLRPGVSFMEPFINFEPIGEVGRSFEAALFGGTPRFFPVFETSTSKIPIAGMCVDYPSILGGSGLGALVDRRHDSMDPMETIRVKWLPTALLWRFQSKAFWESNPPPNGQHGFIFPSAFTGEQFYAPEFLLRQYTEVEVNPDAELTAPLHDAARKWHEQIRLWATGRPWYNGENLTRWKQTPWGHAEMREHIEAYILAYQAHDEVKCANVAWILTRRLPAENLRATLANPNMMIADQDTMEGSPTAWLFYFLGMLMLAALPTRMADVRLYQFVKTVTLTASQESAAKFTDTVQVQTEDNTDSFIHSRATFISRFSDRGETNSFDRQAYITEARDALDYFALEKRVLVPKLLLQELLTLLVYIETELNKPDCNKHYWLGKFPFKLPPYDPYSYLRWNPHISDWEEVERT